MALLTSTKSPYAEWADKYADLGYSPIPVRARGKAPIPKNWQRFCDTLPTAAERAGFARICNANIGLAMGVRVGDYQMVAVDLDIDGDALDMLSASLPASPMEKRAAKGLTRFYRAAPSLATARFKTADGRGLADLQCHGTQVVVPPSIHPSGIPYSWTGVPCAASELPILDEDALERFYEALERIGWPRGDDEAAEAAKAALGAPDGLDGAVDLYATMHTRALANLETWVPALGLVKLRRMPGGYKAVAHWRASSKGRDISERKSSLSIHARGIVDHGTGMGYSPTTLVMAATGKSRDDAFAFLFERTGMKAEEDAFIASIAPWIERLSLQSEEQRRSRQAEARALLSAEGALLVRDEAGVPEPSSNCGLIWDDEEANAALAVDWLVKGLFPRKGVSLLFGQSGLGKGFVTADLAACVVSGIPFFEHKVKNGGGVLFALGEGEGAMPGRIKAIRRGKFGGVAPENPNDGTALDLQRLPIVWTSAGGLSKPAGFAEFERKVRAAHRQMPERFDMRLALVVVDTVVATFGFDEDPDGAKVTNALKSLDALGQELDLLIVAVHHAGKSKEAGEHGSYAWRGSAETSIWVDGNKSPLGVITNRRLILVKNRHAGNEGWNAPFELEGVSFGVDEDGDDVGSAYLKQEDLPPLRVGERSHTVGVSRFMDALTPVHASASVGIETEDGRTVHAARLRDVEAQHKAGRGGTADALRRMFQRDRDAALEAGLVERCRWDSMDYVWPATAEAPDADNDNTPDNGQDIAGQMSGTLSGA